MKKSPSVLRMKEQALLTVWSPAPAPAPAIRSYTSMRGCQGLMWAIPILGDCMDLLGDLILASNFKEIAGREYFSCE